MATTSSQQNKELQDQAAAIAASMVTGGSHKKINPLDSNNKLSSASAAQSLKRAQPRDLPSFPIKGVANSQASAGAAASLAFAEQKSFEHWKPERSRPAGKAALLAHDSKPPEFWQPEASLAGSKAALLAHKNTTGVNIWQPDEHPEGNSAAGLAMKGKKDDTFTKSSSPALGSTRRQRAESIPVSYTYPDSANSASNALKAATKAHTPKSETPVYNDLPGFSPEQAARIHKAATTNMDRAMYTSSPPVAPEVEEKNRQAGLRAAAVSMAKNMMIAQERAAEMHEHDLDGQNAARASHGGKTSVEVDRREAALQYLTLQEAAKKLAAERLAKINDESEEYRQYYGAFSPGKSRMSLRSRRRSSSDGQLDSSDRARSEKIRNEMSLFNSKLAEVDSKKRQSDRDALLAAAQRNVQNSMKGLDEKVFQKTGQASPAMKAQWEAAAREKAEKDSKARLENHGKVHIGGGVFMDQSEIDAIARGKVQPIIDDIDKRTQAQRTADMLARQEAEQQRQAAIAKAKEEKERNQQTKQAWQQFKTEEKEKKKEEREEDEVEQIYRKTAQEQDRKAREAEEAIKRAEAEKTERERQAKLDSSWQQFKETEKEEEKKQKTQDKRKSRIGSMFASIGIGGSDKKEEPKEIKSKTAEPVKTQTTKAENVQPKTTIEEEISAAPAFTSAAVAEAFEKIRNEQETTTKVSLTIPGNDEQKDDVAVLTSIPDVESSHSEALKPASPPATTTILTSPSKAQPTQTIKSPEKEEKQSWFKRKFSRSTKDGRPQPGAISSLKREKDDKPTPSVSKGKDLKISAPIAVTSTAAGLVATESLPSTTATESTKAQDIKDESISTEDREAAPASAVPSHVHRNDDTTNLSERDVALAGKDDSSLPAANPEQTPRSRSTSISSLTSGSITPSGSMRGVASAAMAASSHLESEHAATEHAAAEEALRAQSGEANGLSHVSTSATGESQYEEAEDVFETPSVEKADLGLGVGTAAGAASTARSVSVSSAPRETKFHEEL